MKNKAVNLPEELYKQVEKKLAETGFNSVDEFVVYVVTKVLEDESPEKEMTAEDEAEVKKRLKNLGYF